MDQDQWWVCSCWMLLEQSFRSFLHQPRESTVHWPASGGEIYGAVTCLCVAGISRLNISGFPVVAGYLIIFAYLYIHTSILFDQIHWQEQLLQCSPLCCFFPRLAQDGFPSVQGANSVTIQVGFKRQRLLKEVTGGIVTRHPHRWVYTTSIWGKDLLRVSEKETSWETAPFNDVCVLAFRMFVQRANDDVSHVLWLLGAADC